MVNKYLSLLVVFFLSSCFSIKLFDNPFLGFSIKDKELEDGSIVPAVYRYKNIKYFDESIYQEIDINHLYTRKYEYIADAKFNYLKDDYQEGISRTIQFYPDGHVRMFSFDKTNPDPEKAGRRAVIYKKKDKIFIDETYGFEGSDITICTISTKIIDGKLYILHDSDFLKSKYRCEVYEKGEKIPDSWKQYKPDW
jgi:hypothetical protein